MNRFWLSHDGAATWQLDGEAVGDTRSFGSLADAIAHARDLAHAEEALIELHVSGFYACVHQERGWPHRIEAAAKKAA